MHSRRPRSFWISSLGYTLLQRLAVFGFGVLGFMMLARMLEPARLGVWALYITCFALFEMVKQGLLRNALVRALGKDPSTNIRNAYLSASLAIHIAFSLAMVVLVISAAGGLGQVLQAQELPTLLRWSLILVMLLIPYHHGEFVLQAMYGFRTLFWAGLIRQGGFFAGLCWFWWEGGAFALEDMVYLQIAALLLALVFILITRQGLFPTRFLLLRQPLWELLGYGRFTLGTNLFAALTRSLDHFLTAALLGPLAGKIFTAYYHTIGRIGNLVDIPALAATDVLFPKAARTWAGDGLNKARQEFVKAGGALLALAFPLAGAVFLFPGLVVRVVAGDQYEGAVPLLRILILFSTVRALSYVFGSTLDALGHARENFRVNLLMMGLNLIGIATGLILFGGYGAAYGISVCNVLHIIIMHFTLQSKLNVGMGELFQSALGWYRQLPVLLKRIG